MTLVSHHDEVKKMVVDTKIEDVERISEITEFFTGCNIFVTGGSGFVGKVLVEKLLRTCPKLKKIYLLMRPKKGKTPQDRLKEHFEDPLYDRLKFEQPDYATRVMMIEGSFEAKGLVLTPEDREMMKNTHVVFHAAATVRFDDKLRFAANINIRGTRDILLYAREMPNLKAVVHIGTAFSMCVNKFIDEVFYKTLLGADDLLTIIDILDDPTLEHITPTLIGKWPNTYAFTKTVAEDAVLCHSKGLPVCIVRPSIMISTAHEPIPGWINNLYGATGVAVASSLGILHTINAKGDYIADMIPADYVINNIIAAAWDVGTQRRTDPLRTLPSSQKNELTEEPEEDEKPKIYNVVSSVDNPISWSRYLSYGELHGVAIPSVKTLWYYMLCVDRYYWLHLIHLFLYHLLPAAIIDAGLFITGRKPQVLNIYKKIHKFLHVITYFSTNQWTFGNKNVRRLWNKLNPIDKKIYYFNVGDLNWKDYSYHYMRGIRVFIFKDTWDTLPAQKKRYFKLKIAHYTFLTVESILLLWLAYFLLTTFVPLLLSFCPYYNK
ncbi:fatty acyl-CoA reductase wat-like [Chelonus insularis]|uniref:fatty acyl-CoA reductase wat-like n=1 Tax=Chelonus insularis TaxID=460826 RepID=UPI00158BC8B7|nr:fatty acyl-CoA reductase wat-like [Chelonus insularis]